MFQMQEYIQNGLSFYKLMNEISTSWLTVCSERGGIIIVWGVGGDEQLYLNEDTLYNLEKNIRGGIPVLLPISGKF
ncbi:hypothetical protein [Jeotgalibacillus proteolyticus]|uniref:hypothetical protein n=1 Tax=Jeotgalibacillus proteolyticus TaxID=2082395 RepID=UPI003CF38B7B